MFKRTILSTLIALSSTAIFASELTPVSNISSISIKPEMTGTTSAQSSNYGYANGMQQFGYIISINYRNSVTQEQADYDLNHIDLKIELPDSKGNISSKNISMPGLDAICSPKEDMFSKETNAPIVNSLSNGLVLSSLISDVGTTLHSGDKLSNDQITLFLDPNGNLELYKNNDPSSIIWFAPRPVSMGIKSATLSKNGGLNVYDDKNTLLWSSHVNANDTDEMILALQPDDNMVIYINSQAKWSTNTFDVNYKPDYTNVGNNWKMANDLTPTSLTAIESDEFFGALDDESKAAFCLTRQRNSVFNYGYASTDSPTYLTSSGQPLQGVEAAESTSFSRGVYIQYVDFKPQEYKIGLSYKDESGESYVVDVTQGDSAHIIQKPSQDSLKTCGQNFQSYGSSHHENPALNYFDIQVKDIITNRTITPIEVGVAPMKQSYVECTSYDPYTQICYNHEEHNEYMWGYGPGENNQNMTATLDGKQNVWKDMFQLAVNSSVVPTNTDPLHLVNSYVHNMPIPKSDNDKAVMLTNGECTSAGGTSQGCLNSSFVNIDTNTSTVNFMFWDSNNDSNDRAPYTADLYARDNFGNNYKLNNQPLLQGGAIQGAEAGRGDALMVYTDCNTL